MKAALFSLATILSFVAMPLVHATRAVPVVKADIRVLGPAGQAMIFYADPSSNQIVLMNCGADYPIPLDHRDDCQGPTVSFSKAEFKKLLKETFLALPEDQAATPFTIDEEKTYKYGPGVNVNQNQREITELQDLISRIDFFLKNGAGSWAQYDKDRAAQRVTTLQNEIQMSTNLPAVRQKVEAFLDDVIQKTVDAKTFFKVADGRDGQTAVFQILLQIFKSYGRQT